jgi:serine phosphatase RsbU (regulator of sigma subunit)
MVVMKHYISLLFAALCVIVIAPMLYSAEPVVIDTLFTGKSLGRRYEYLEDRNKKYTITALTMKATQDRYKWDKADQDVFNKGYTKSAYWLRFSARNRLNNDIDIYLQLSYPHIREVSLFIPVGDGFREVKTGNRFPYRQRPMKHRTFVFPLNIPAHSTETYYLRCETAGTLSVPLMFYSPEVFQEMVINETIFLYMFYGMLLIMALYNSIIFIASRDLSYGYYTMYIVLIGIISMTLNGHAYQYLWSESPRWGIKLFPIFICLITVAVIQFGRYFINTRHHAPLVDKGSLAFVVISVAVSLAMIPLGNYSIVIRMSILLAGASIIYHILSYIFIFISKRTKEAAYFLSAFLLFFLGVMAYILKSLGIIEEGLFTNYGFQMGVAAQITLLSLGLADKLNTMRKELVIFNTDLEVKVNERTEELQSTMEEMEEMNFDLIRTRDALWGEMQIAKKIQTVLLPEKPNIPGYDIIAYMNPANEVGGDYYDVINATGMDWLLIGDVSGHGVPAGLVMMMTQTLVNGFVEDQPNMSPSDLLVKINKTLRNNIQKLGGDKYMTLMVLAAHKDGRFIFSGLHLDILVYRAQQREVEIVETSGMWIGVMNDIKGIVRDDTFELLAGDTILLYTDGITEAWIKNSEKDIRDTETAMFGQDRLMEVFYRNGHLSLDEIKKSIIAALSDYQCKDDVTMMIIRRL